MNTVYKDRIVHELESVLTSPRMTCEVVASVEGWGDMTFIKIETVVGEHVPENRRLRWITGTGEKFSADALTPESIEIVTSYALNLWPAIESIRFVFPHCGTSAITPADIAKERRAQA